LEALEVTEASILVALVNTAIWCCLYGWLLELSLPLRLLLLLLLLELLLLRKSTVERVVHHHVVLLLLHLAAEELRLEATCTCRLLLLLLLHLLLLLLLLHHLHLHVLLLLSQLLLSHSFLLRLEVSHGVQCVILICGWRCVWILVVHAHDVVDSVLLNLLLGHLRLETSLLRLLHWLSGTIEVTEPIIIG